MGHMERGKIGLNCALKGSTHQSSPHDMVVFSFRSQVLYFLFVKTQIPILLLFFYFFNTTKADKKETKSWSNAHIFTPFRAYRAIGFTFLFRAQVVAICGKAEAFQWPNQLGESGITTKYRDQGL